MALFPLRYGVCVLSCPLNLGSKDAWLWSRVGVILDQFPIPGLKKLVLLFLFLQAFISGALRYHIRNLNLLVVKKMTTIMLNGVSVSVLGKPS